MLAGIFVDEEPEESESDDEDEEEDEVSTLQSYKIKCNTRTPTSCLLHYGTFLPNL